MLLYCSGSKTLTKINLEMLYILLKKTQEEDPAKHGYQMTCPVQSERRRGGWNETDVATEVTIDGHRLQC